MEISSQWYPAALEHGVGPFVAPGQRVLVGVAPSVPGQWRARLDGQGVGAHVRRRVVEPEDVVEAADPVVVALGRRAEHEVEVPGGEAGLGHGGRDRLGGPGHAPPPQTDQHDVVGRLQSEGEARHTGPLVCTQVGAVGVLGIALDRHFCARAARDGLEDVAEEVGMEAGGGAPSEEDGGGIDEAAVLDGAGHLADAGLRVALHEVVAVGVGGEGAVVAALPAERDVDVDTEGGQRVAVERTERMRRSRWTSMASVASSATSSPAGGGGPESTAARSPPRMRRSRTSAAALMGRPLRWARHKVPPDTRSKATSSTSPSGSPQVAHAFEQRAGAFENERFEEEGGSHQGVLGVVLGQGAQRADEHGVEPGVGVALLSHLVGHLEEGHAAGQALEVLSHGTEGAEHLDLVHDVEVAAPLPEQEVDVGQGLEPGAELRRGLAHTLGHGAHLAVALGEEDDDAVGLAQAVGAQDDALVAEEAHCEVVGERCAGSSGQERSPRLAASAAARRRSAARSAARSCASWAGRSRSTALAPCESRP